MKKTSLILLCLTCPSHAATTRELGTVFYSPAERAELVAARSGVAQSAVYTLSGIVERGSGKSAAWINGRAVTEVPPDPVIPNLVIRTDHVLIDGKVIRVGESLDIVTGQRVLRLPEKSVRVQP